MSTPTLDFWFDYSCPYAYLASTQVAALAARTGADLRWRPMLLGGIFQARGTPQNLMNTLSPAKARHNALDMARWAERWEVPLRVPAGHPLRTVEALRATLLAGVDPAVVHGFFHAYWVDGREPSAPETLRAVLAAAGHDADALLARLGDAGVKDDLRARTTAALELGIFGAPSFVTNGGELFWGQDRLDQVERALRPDVPSTPPEPAPAPAASGRTLELYWDFSSPYAYLASTQAEALAARTGATLVWRPMLLGGLFKTIGQADVPLATWSPAKREYAFRDMARSAAGWSAPFAFPSRFPMNTVKALRAWLALPEARRAPFLHAAFRAYWAEDRDISDEAVLRELLGADADAALARINTPEVKQGLIAATQRAADAGVFGAPTWVLDGTALYWGQDRIPLVERALRGR